MRREPRDCLEALASERGISPASLENAIQQIQAARHLPPVRSSNNDKLYQAARLIRRAMCQTFGSYPDV